MKSGGLYKTQQFANPKYVGDPLNAVKIFNEKQVDELMLLDIGLPTEARPDFRLLEKIAIESRMPLCYGGGVKRVEQLCRIVNMGFEKVSVSTAAIKNPRVVRDFADAVGRQSVVVTLDVKYEPATKGYVVFTENGQVRSPRDVFDLCAELVSEGAGEIVLNSIDREGMMKGYDLVLAQAMSAHIRIPLTFIGGAGNVGHMRELIHAVGVVGAGAGSMFVFRGPYRAVLINYQRP